MILKPYTATVWLRQNRTKQLPVHFVSAAGVVYKDGKVLYRECKYVSDFEYDMVSTGEHVVEDVKGIVLPIFKIKQKLMYDKFGIEVKVVKKW